MARSGGAVRLTPEEMAQHIPDAAGNRFHIGLERGQLQVEFYIPEGSDLQQAHSRDECYVVIRGSGRFRMGAEVVPFNAGALALLLSSSLFPRRPQGCRGGGCCIAGRWAVAVAHVWFLWLVGGFGLDCGTTIPGERGGP